ncbi:uncharacterized protein BJ212DRAFT_1300894 [Suillus subaureus]|uniref:Uncharacterized protein n=1 Tax=Suillus subaureus TaxID=48587 RepID=A0A9P7JBY2_9AGAM|nr:uncharacterized protein BJ212DRAFT_1300894 [Suillus subaureus]KAG1814040.1 hypothetical protein BJ212DRAFT_1300894 [Suillus subaureus]
MDRTWEGGFLGPDWSKSRWVNIYGFNDPHFISFSEACWISIRDKDKPDVFVDGAFKPWTNEEQCQLGDQYCKLTTPTTRKNFSRVWLSMHKKWVIMRQGSIVNSTTGMSLGSLVGSSYYLHKLANSTLSQSGYFVASAVIEHWDVEIVEYPNRSKCGCFGQTYIWL